MVSIRHATTAVGTDAGTGEIHKPQWNEDHLIVGDLVASGALVFLGKVNASNQATVDLTSLISSLYDEYEIHLVGVRPISDTVNLKMLLSTDNGASWLAANYRLNGLYNGHGDSLTAQDNAGTTAWSVADSVTNSASISVNGKITLRLPTGLWPSMSSRVQASYAGNLYWWEYEQVLANLTAVNAMQFKFSSGNVDVGAFRVYGIVKSASVGSRTWPLDRYAIDATYGDDFDGAALSGSWTRRNFTSGAETYQVGPESTYMRVAFSGRSIGDGYFRPAPAGDWTFATAFIPRFYDATGAKLFGIAVVDTAGTGLWFSSGNGSPAAFDLLQLTTYTTYGGSYVEAGYNGAAPNVSYISDVMPYQRKVWLSLRKSGTNYYASFSVDGEVWGVESSALAWAGTVDRVGLIYGPLSGGTLTNGYVDLDWFNKIA